MSGSRYNNDSASRMERARREVFTPLLVNDRAYVVAEEAVDAAVRAGGIPAPYGRWRIANRCRRVATGRTREQLREALLDTAAACIAWAARLRQPPSFHRDPDQLTQGRGERQS